MEENNNKEELNEVLESETAENTIKISDDVVSIIAGKAVSEVEGVSSMAGGFAGGITEVLSGKKNFSKGIKVEVGEYGTRIPDIAFEIQNRVKKAVENMTGLKVLEVNVHVQGVHTSDDDEKENSPEVEENKEQ